MAFIHRGSICSIFTQINIFVVCSYHRATAHAGRALGPRGCFLPRRRRFLSEQDPQHAIALYMAHVKIFPPPFLCIPSCVKLHYALSSMLIVAVVQELRLMFSLYDKDGSGTVSVDIFSWTLTSPFLLKSLFLLIDFLFW